MKRKICAFALVVPLIFTISYSQKNEEPIVGIGSSVSKAVTIKNVKLMASNRATTTEDITNSTANYNGLSAAEQQMVNLVNQARAKNHVPALKVDMQLTNVARIKAQDMITNKYFSHTSPKYGSPFAMMKSFGIQYVTAGENIAGNSSIQAAQTSLMNSPGHRKNILNPGYTYIGIGIKSGGPYGNMISQMFISKPQ